MLWVLTLKCVVATHVEVKNIEAKIQFPSAKRFAVAITLETTASDAGPRFKWRTTHSFLSLLMYLFQKWKPNWKQELFPQFPQTAIKVQSRASRICAQQWSAAAPHCWAFLRKRAEMRPHQCNTVTVIQNRANNWRGFSPVSTFKAKCSSRNWRNVYCFLYDPPKSIWKRSEKDGSSLWWVRTTKAVPPLARLAL